VIWIGESYVILVFCFKNKQMLFEF